jgi:hypothetical protein
MSGVEFFKAKLSRDFRPLVFNQAFKYRYSKSLDSLRVFFNRIRLDLKKKT